MKEALFIIVITGFSCYSLGMEFTSSTKYHEHLDRIPLPLGVTAGTTSLEFFPEELAGEGDRGAKMTMNMTLLALDKPTDRFAALYTRNAFPGHPVVIGKELLSESHLKGLIINNKISNVECPRGYEKSQELRRRAEELIPGEGVVFPFSTGIIGWELPLDEMVRALPGLTGSLKAGSALSPALSIMTTDAFPKARTRQLGEGVITGICKGAGMIEPHLATMLVFVMTDIDIPREKLDLYWKEACEDSFNRISVDSDQSTSDTAFIFSTGRVPCTDEEAFRQALADLTGEMARDIVRNGEGTGHVMEVDIMGAMTKDEAVTAGKALVNSPLTKSAVYGNDPNVGRLIQALGDWAGCRDIPLDRKKVSISLGGVDLYRDGAFLLDGKKEKVLHSYLKERALPLPSPGFPAHDKNVNITIRLARGDENARIWGSDLSCEYVVINAEYRS